MRRDRSGARAPPRSVAAARGAPRARLFPFSRALFSHVLREPQVLTGRFSSSRASLRHRPPPSWSLEQNPDMQRRIAGLKDDPEFQEFFQDVQKNGPSAMMKYSKRRF